MTTGLTFVITTRCIDIIPNFDCFCKRRFQIKFLMYRFHCKWAGFGGLKAFLFEKRSGGWKKSARNVTVQSKKSSRRVILSSEGLVFPAEYSLAVYFARRSHRITLQSHFGGLFLDIRLQLACQNRFRRGISADGQKLQTSKTAKNPQPGPIAARSAS